MLKKVYHLRWQVLKWNTVFINSRESDCFSKKLSRETSSGYKLNLSISKTLKKLPIMQTTEDVIHFRIFLEKKSFYFITTTQSVS